MAAITQIQARWVVDASGRSSLLKRQLGLAKKVGHHANAVWFRIGYPIDINDMVHRSRLADAHHRG